MKNKLLLGIFSIGIMIPCMVGASGSDGWVQGHAVSSDKYLNAERCKNIESFSCDYTGDPVVLRMGYGVDFYDTFYAGNQDRRLWGFCAGIIEPKNNGDYNNGDNPEFVRTGVSNTLGRKVPSGTYKTIIQTEREYQIRKHPLQRSSDNLMVKYVVEYANNGSDNAARYQHTECYPYEISRCGDGVVDKTWDGKTADEPAEDCDPEAPERKNRSDGKVCNNSCKIEYATPMCSSTYNGKSKYTSSSNPRLNGTENLCEVGTPVDFSYSGTPRIYTWNCKNGSKKTDSPCVAKQEWCGDGVMNGNEECDDGAKNGTSTSSCSATCKNVVVASCGTLGGGSTYFSAQQTTPWLNINSAGMCANGSIVGIPYITGTNNHIEWTCSNANGTSIYCKAYQQYCGDGIVNGSEECDGTEGCDSSCKRINQSTECHQTFTGKLRLGYNKPFTDTFNAGGRDRYLYYKEVVFNENHGDYNNGQNPTFNWTSELVNHGMKVDANTSMIVLESNLYHIVSAPSIRARNNLYIEYNVWYDNVKHSTTPSKANLYSHKECAYYEISRCGDGIKDPEYGEECDPGSEVTSTLPNGQICNSECKIETSKKGSLVVKKTLLSDRYVTETGQELKWQIKVTASGGNLKNVIITDDLPPVLSYVAPYETNLTASSSVTMLPNQPTITSGGKHLEWKTSGMLNSGESIILSITTKVDVMPDKNGYKNVACAREEGDDEKICDHQPIDTGKPRLRIKKHFTDGSKVKSVQIGDEIAYRIDFGNSGNVAATVTSIKDFLPKNVKFKEGAIYLSTSSEHGTDIQATEMKNVWSGYNVVQGVQIEIYGGITLKPNQIGYIILTGVVLSENTDNRTNFACIYLNDKKIECDGVIHNLGVMCEKLYIQTTSFPHEGGSTKVECKTKNSQIANQIVIDCGNGETITGNNKSYLSGTCSYPRNHSTTATGYNVQCKVNNEENATDKCAGNVEVGKIPSGGESDPKCSNLTIKNNTATCTASEDAYIRIMCGSEVLKSSNGKVDALKLSLGNRTCKKIVCEVSPYNSFASTSTCEKEYIDPNPPHPHNINCETEYYDNQAVCDLASPECLNLNAGNFSIELGEYLPFYFNVERNAKDIHKYKYVRDEDKDKECDVGTVDLKSLKCRYKILSPIDNTVVFEKDGINCLELEERNIDKPLIAKWANGQEVMYGIDLTNDTYSRYWPHIEYTKSDDWTTNGILGEYKFQIVVYQYDQCDYEKGWQTHTMQYPVCGSNFVLTEPYTVQKTPSGNLKASTATLSKFREVNGSTIGFSSYLDAISTSEYAPNAKVKEAMSGFINKYEKLAVKIDKGGKTMKKVPGKNIYFVDDDISINGGDFSTPFTFVQTNPNKTITIKGNSNLNMMILTRGNIAFEGDCSSNQTIKGIFYASGSLIRTGVDKNDYLYNNVWCTKGGLHIKGVLIGNNFNNLMKASRSHLETWFDNNETSSKATKIMNGASVVIEYSPSIFTKSTMPPGAEDFTTALSIYKY